MKQITFFSLGILVPLLFFPGCYRYVDWISTLVSQTDKIETCVEIAKPYIKAARAYDQLTTLGLFDALMLHPEVIEAYACAHAAKYSLNDNQYHTLLTKQLEEHKPYISFYLLATIYGPSGTLLTDPNPIWVVQLKIGDHYYNPAKIKLVELPHEYRNFFGKRWNIFKRNYLIQFDAYDSNNNPLIGPLVREVELVFKRVGHEVCMLWCLDSQQQAIISNSIDQDNMIYDLDVNRL